MTGKRKGASTSRITIEHREELFALAFIANGGNGAAAAVAAGYAEHSARRQAVKLLERPRVREMIQQHQQTLTKKYELDADLVIRSIVQELSFDPAKLYRGNGSLKDIAELDEDTRMALASVEFEQIGGADSPVSVRKVKWASRHQAREQAMKHLGLFEKDNRQKGSALASILAEIDGSDTGLPAAG